MQNSIISKRYVRLTLHVLALLLIITAVIFMMPQNSDAASGPGYAKGRIDASDGATLRKSSSTSSKELAVIADGTAVTIYREVYKSKTSTARTKVWYYVKANGIKGYIRSDLVDDVEYTLMSAKITAKVNYRKGPGTKMKKKGTLKKGSKVTVYLDARPVSSTKGGSKIWYRIYHNGSYGYVCSKYVKITGSAGSSSSASNPTPDQLSKILSATSNAFSKMSEKQFENYLKNQGFPEAYKVRLRELHKKHPNWIFTAYKTGISWSAALKKESAKGVSLIYKSYPKSYRASGSKQVEPGWYNANSTVVAYYMDPRNFLNEDRIFMFEDLSYRSEYQTTAVVNRIIGTTKLPGYGFTASVFMNAGKTYKVSPVFLAARVVQETGGNSVSVNGSKSGGTKVYNPFNIGAYGSNPAARGLAYAKKKGWTTPAKAVNGGAAYLASGYITKKQNSLYLQRFNVANGAANVGNHQYMTNIMAPYSESHITKTSYAKLGITNEPLGFMIPIYTGMPASTRLP